MFFSLIKLGAGGLCLCFGDFQPHCTALAEKAVAPHSSTFAWKIPWTEEPGRLHAVHGVTRSWTGLSDFTFTFHFHALQKEMATHSSVLAWRIPGRVEPGGLPSMGLHRVGHDWSDLAVPPSGFKPMPSAVKSWSPIHWNTRQWPKVVQKKDN